MRAAFATRMPSWWRQLREAMPASFLAALALAGGFLGFVAWDQSHWWRIKPDYGFGWLVPLLTAYVVHDRWPQIRARIAACAADGSPRAAGWRGAALATGAGASLLGGAGLFLLGAFYRAGAGTSQPGTLAITLGAVAIVFSLLFLNAPASARPAAAALRDDARLRLLAGFAFPVLVWLISAPLVSIVEGEINRALMRGIVSIVAFVFDLLGFVIERRGNVLDVPFGSVGIEEACSGIRSLMVCVFAGSFLAAVFLEELGKKFSLVLLAVAFGLLANLGRSFFLTAWAYGHRGAISGAVHDLAGYAVLGVTVSALLWRVWRAKAR